MRLHHASDVRKVVFIQHPLVEETAFDSGVTPPEQRSFDLHRRLGGQPEPLELVELSPDGVFDLDEDLQ